MELEAIQSLSTLAQTLEAAKRAGETSATKGQRGPAQGSASAPARKAPDSPLEHLGSHVNFLA